MRGRGRERERKLGFRGGRAVRKEGKRGKEKEKNFRV